MEKIEMTQDIGLVLKWWWRLTAFQVWALLAIREDYWDIIWKYVDSWSGWWLNAPYVVSQAIQAMIEIWKFWHVSTKEIVNFYHINPFSKKKILNLPKLMHVLRDIVPLDVDKVRNSPTILSWSATSAITGKSERFTNKSKQNIFDVMEASAAVPIVYGWLVELKEWEQFWDHINSSQCNNHKYYMNKNNVSHTLSISASDWFSKSMMELALIWKPSVFAKNIRKEFDRNVVMQKKLLNDPSHFSIKPMRKIRPGPKSFLNNSQKFIDSLMEQWHRETKNNKEFHKWIKKCL